jgi:predicted transglutaminase-like cysteine proteinase
MWLLSPLTRLAEHLTGNESAWDRVTLCVPPKAFGPGSELPFAEYFQGESSVQVQSIDDIVSWLRECEYAGDLELFQKKDHWQHPGTFEEHRRGDCEDFALWAWRKLTEVGVEAEFYVGRVICNASARGDRQHAWVVYQVDGALFLFEPAARTAPSMIRPLEDARDDYIPHFAVNHRFETSAFAGCASHSTASDDPAS